MCGRFSNSEDPEIIAAYYLAKLVAKGWKPTWNAAPTQELPVVAMHGGERQLAVMRWGWTRAFASQAGSRLLVNARGEEAASKPTWREALRRRRCLVPATAFYEWREAANQPYAFRLRSGSLFSIAAVWEAVGEAQAFVLLTTPANPLVASVHHRMACILPREVEAEWLDPTTPAERIQQLIVPFPAEAMTCTPVSQKVNAVRNDGPELVAPVAIAEQQDLFGG